MNWKIRPRSFYRPGRLVANPKKGLRARVVVLEAGKSVSWHSTDDREELIFSVSGSVRVEMEKAGTRHARRFVLKSGSCFFIPAQTFHRVVNPFSRVATYVYVTAPQG